MKFHSIQRQIVFYCRQISFLDASQKASQKEGPTARRFVDRPIGPIVGPSELLVRANYSTYLADESFLAVSFNETTFSHFRIAHAYDFYS